MEGKGIGKEVSKEFQSGSTVRGIQKRKGDER